MYDMIDYFYKYYIFFKLYIYIFRQDQPYTQTNGELITITRQISQNYNSGVITTIKLIIACDL